MPRRVPGETSASLERDPRLDGLLEILPLLLHLGGVGEPTITDRPAAALERGMRAGELGALVEHQAHVLLRARIDAGDVPLEDERRALPLDRLGDPRVDGQDGVADLIDLGLERMA